MRHCHTCATILRPDRRGERGRPANGSGTGPPADARSAHATQCRARLRRPAARRCGRPGGRWSGRSAGRDRARRPGTRAVGGIGAGGERAGGATSGNGRRSLLAHCWRSAGSLRPFKGRRWHSMAISPAGVGCCGRAMLTCWARPIRPVGRRLPWTCSMGGHLELIMERHDMDERWQMSVLREQLIRQLAAEVGGVLASSVPHLSPEIADLWRRRGRCCPT